MPKVLTGSHAEDVGGYVIEPGQEIPSDADAAVVKRLEDEGLVLNTRTRKTKEEED